MSCVSISLSESERSHLPPAPLSGTNKHHRTMTLLLRIIPRLYTKVRLSLNLTIALNRLVSGDVPGMLLVLALQLLGTAVLSSCGKVGFIMIGSASRK